MAIPSPEKEARGRKAAESREKSDAELLEDRQKNKEKFENMLDDMRILRTKESILNLRKKTLEYNVSTIHSYCNAIAKQVTKGIEFDLDDYEIMAQMYPLFSKHTRSKKFKDIESLFKLHPFFKSLIIFF